MLFILLQSNSINSLLFWILSIAVSIFFIYLKIKKGRIALISPGFVFMITWGIVCISMLFFLGNKDLFQSSLFKGDYHYLSSYVFLFVVVSFIGFSLPNVMIKQNESEDQWLDYLPESQIDSIFNRYRFIFYLNFALVLVKLVFIIFTFSPTSYYHYRQIILSEVFTQDSFTLISIVSRFGYWTQLISGFLVAVLGVKHGISQFKFKQAILYFTLYSAVSLVDGGRVFILQFSVFYFLPYTLIYLRRGAEIWTREFKRLFFFLIIIFSLVGVLGVFRSSDRYSQKSSNDLVEKYYYLMNGIGYTNKILTRVDFNIGNLDFGRNFFNININSTISYRMQIHNKLPRGYENSVQSIIPYIFFDFGYMGSLAFWAIVCFFIEFIALRMYRRMSIFKLLIIITLCRYAFGTFLGNPLPYLVRMFAFIFIVYILKKFLIPRYRYSE